MKKSFLLLFSLVILAFVVSCGEDDSKGSSAVSVSFANQSINLTENATPVNIVFSTPPAMAGEIVITFAESNVNYGAEFSTSPAADGNKLTIPFNAGVSSVNFMLNKLTTIDTEGSVTFSITSVSNGALVTGLTATALNFYEAPALGSLVEVAVGGPTQPNQVYVDLSSGGIITVPRASWDLGFYSGDKFRVVLNGSLKMTAKSLNTTNIDEVVQEDSSMLFGQGEGAASVVDHPSGDLTKTVIAEISDNPEDNKVYLINLGNGPANVAPAVGTDGSAGGAQRGWKKIRVLKSGNDYVVEYADIAATTHQQITITKDGAYNYSFFSFATGATAQVEPQKNQWDLNFTTFTNFVENNGADVPYYFPDFIVTNVKGGARSYQVLTEEFTYEAFTKANVVAANFTEDQRNIGSNWRSTSVMGPSGFPVSQFVLKTDRFFVVQDPAGNLYKLKMTGGANEAGERGFPEFEYKLLQ
jgi:hypothetical protein